MKFDKANARKNQITGLSKLYSIFRDHGMTHDEALKATMEVVVEVLTVPVKKKAP